MEKYIIDRISDTSVYLETEDGQLLRLDRALLPAEMTEGAVLIKDAERWIRSDCERTVRRNVIKEKLDGLFGRRNL